MRRLSCVASGESKRQSSTRAACSEKSAKLTPAPSQVAPRGYGRPGKILIGVPSRLFKKGLGRWPVDAPLLDPRRANLVTGGTVTFERFPALSAMSAARLPTATYRLQFNRRFTFRDARALIEYLDALGVSEVYASPLTAARPGSPHGYDVIDPTRLNPELGSREEFEAFTQALASRGMGLILDVVPNHMCAADPGNRWWQHVLERAPSSPDAKYFAINSHPAKIDLSE